MEFFAQQGFACPARKGVADFLQEVTSSKDQEVRCRLRAGVFNQCRATPVYFRCLAQTAVG